MASIDLIVGLSDASSITNAIDRANLKFFWNKGLKSQLAELEEPSALEGLSGASVYLTKAEWIFGEIQFNEHYNKAERQIYYYIKPRVNFYALSLSYYPEQAQGEIRKLGVGDLDSYKNWLRMPNNALESAPEDAAKIFRTVVRMLRTDAVTLRTSHGNKLVLRHAVRRYLEGVCRMPAAWLEPFASAQLPTG